MNVVFSFLFFVSLLCLLLGILRPALFSWVFKQKPTRKAVMKKFGLLSLIFFVMGMLTIPPKDHSRNEKLTPSESSLLEEKDELEDVRNSVNVETDVTQTVRFGLSVVERKQFFRETVAAEDRADKEAEEKYPLDDPNMTMEFVEKYAELYQSLSEKYKMEVRNSYGLSESEAIQVVVEGVSAKWPMN